MISSYSLFIDVTPARFNGSQYISISALIPNQTITEEFIVKFKTRLPSGVIFTTQTSQSDDSVTVFMYQSKLMIKYLLSGYQQVCSLKFIQNSECKVGDSSNVLDRVKESLWNCCCCKSFFVLQGGYL